MALELFLGLTVLVIFFLWFGRRLFLRQESQRPWIVWAQERLRTASTPRLPLKLRSAVGNAVASLIRVADLTPELSPDAQALVQKCYQDIDPTQLLDYHTHLFGTGGGCCESGCLIPPEEDRDLKLQTVSTVFMKCAGVRSKETGDDDFIEMLKRLVHGKHVLLAFDRHFREDGTFDKKKTK
jgi:hypothetical protein